MNHGARAQHAAGRANRARAVGPAAAPRDDSQAAPPALAESGPKHCDHGWQIFGHGVAHAPDRLAHLFSDLSVSLYGGLFASNFFPLELRIRLRNTEPHGEAASVGHGHREEAMTQNTKWKQMPTKSGEWLEAECLKLARRTLGGSEIQYVTIRRLHPKGTGPNWKVADLIPQPTPLVSREVRDALAHLTGIYALEDEGD